MQLLVCFPIGVEAAIDFVSGQWPGRGATTPRGLMGEAVHARATHGFSGHDAMAPTSRRHRHDDSELGGRLRDGALMDAGERAPLHGRTERQTVSPGEIGLEPRDFLEA